MNPPYPSLVKYFPSAITFNSLGHLISHRCVHNPITIVGLRLMKFNHDIPEPSRMCSVYGDDSVIITFKETKSKPFKLRSAAKVY